MPQLENALLAGHDIIFLGERGQAKTRMIRSLTEPARRVAADRRRLARSTTTRTRPVSKHARDLVARPRRRHADRLGPPRRPLRREAGHPDTSIADLIGEVDPIKVAEGRYLSDELTLHYGLVPRTNRGIFAINELPDLAERIQVGLLNVLEERDVQVRGYKIRLPLDVLLVASANPDDYTNRGRIITPLKDRFGSQIRTHYPLEVETEVAIMRQEARPAVGGRRARRRSPTTWRRSSPRSPTSPARARHVNQRSGVSVRLSVSNLEVLAANAVRRALRSGEREVVPRVCDLEALAVVDVGQDRDREPRGGPRGPDRREHAARRRCSPCSRSACRSEQLREVVAAFDEGVVAHTGEDIAVGAARPSCVVEVPALREPVPRSPRATSRRPPWPAPSSSCSRACTCRSGSTRTPSGARATYRGRS